MSLHRFLAVAATVLVAAACSEQQNPTGVALEPSLAVGGNAGPSAGGHANLTTGGGLQTFSFHARENEQGTSGTFELFSRGQEAQFHGTVTCLNVVGNEAFISGVITNSKLGAIPVGTGVAWAVRDNGEGAGVADEWTDVFEFVLDCKNFTPAFILSLVVTVLNEGGNIQVEP